MSYLYAVQMLIPNYINPVKIGFATNPRRRLAYYTCGPFPVRCLGTWKGKRENEKAAHRAFAEHRMCGEWFYPDPELLLFIQAKTGLINMGPRKNDPPAHRIQGYLNEIRGTDEELHVAAILSKARDVLARFHSVHLSDHQVAVLLNIPPSQLREHKRDGEIDYKPDGRYLIGDLAAFLKKNPHVGRGYRDWKEADQRLFGLGCYS